MTIVAIRRKFPSLIRQAERDLGKRFGKKPTLVFAKNGRPRAEIPRGWNGRSRVVITRRMAKTNETLSQICLLHELREALTTEHGASKTQSHKVAKKFEKLDRKRFHLDKSVGWALREHYGWGKRGKKRQMSLLRLLFS